MGHPAGGAGVTAAGVSVRAMRPDDASSVCALAMRVFEIDLPTEPEALAALLGRNEGKTEHLLRTDPRGSWVAEYEGVIVGAVQAIVRENLWGLSLLVLTAEHRGAGLGRRLLTLAQQHGRETENGLIVSSKHPVAIRSYAAVGFALHPTIDAAGAVSRRRLPALGPGVREGGVEDLELTAAASRHARGASHEPDLGEALRTGARLALCGERGFVLFHEGEVRLLAARDEEAARTLLWWVAAEAGSERLQLGWVTAQQRWAVDVAVRAGLEITPGGPLFVRGRPGALTPFLPSGSYL